MLEIDYQNQNNRGRRCSAAKSTTTNQTTTWIMNTNNDSFTFCKWTTKILPNTTVKTLLFQLLRRLEKNVQLKLSHEHSGFTFEPEHSWAAVLLKHQSGKKYSEALLMAANANTKRRGIATTVMKCLHQRTLLPPSINRSPVAELIWILPSRPVLSIRAAVFIASPKNWNRAFSPRSTAPATLPLCKSIQESSLFATKHPPVTLPLCKPIRALRSAVDGPNWTSSCLVFDTIMGQSSLYNGVVFHRSWQSGCGHIAIPTGQRIDKCFRSSMRCEPCY